MEEKIDISKSFNNVKHISPVTLKDLILFKEEILKEMKEYQNKINISVSKNYEDFSKLLEVANNKLYNYETDKALFMKQIEFIEEKNKLLSSVDEKNGEIKNQLMVIELHLNNCQKELDDACFKYDKTIIDNLLIPGIVGKGCKFPYFKEYINDIQDQINLAISQNKQNANNLIANKQVVEGQIRQLNTKFKKLEYDSKQFTLEKTLLIENKFNQMIETLNNQISSVTSEYHRANIELKSKISDVKNLANSIVDENRKINYKTLTEFEKIKKYFKKLKKSIVELSALLSGGSGLSSGGKFNKNIANNRQQIIQQFNSMIIGLMRDVTKENSSEFNNEINNVLFPKKNVGSLIKQYIEGKIHAEDTKYDEKNKKRYNKQKTIADILNKSKKNNSIPVNDDSNSNINKNNIGANNTLNNNKAFKRKLTVQIKDINKKNNFEINNTSNNENILKKNTFFNNNITQFHIIKEEKNNISSSPNDSLSEDSNIDKKSTINNKIYSKNSYKENNFFNIKIDNSFRKDKNKLFFRSTTSNYDNKFIDIGKKNIDNFNLLKKVQNNDNMNKFEKKTSFQNASFNNNEFSSDKHKNEINILKNVEKIQNENEEKKLNSIPSIISKIDTNEKLKENDANEKIEENETTKENTNNNNKNGNLINNNKENIIIEEKNQSKRINQSEDKIKIYNKEKKFEDKQINNLTNNSSSVPKKSKIIINIKSNFKKNEKLKNDYSSESNFSKYSKNINNNIKNGNTPFISENVNNNESISNNQQKNITKSNSLSATNKRRPLSIMNSCQTRNSSKFRIKNNYNFYLDDIFFDKNEIKNFNYCKDEKIIDKPLLVNQTEFKVDEIKGNLENKLVQLEHFTKKKLDQLVKEIKNFIPIHFNAYLKE